MTSAAMIHFHILDTLMTGSIGEFMKEEKLKERKKDARIAMGLLIAIKLLRAF